MEKVLEILNDAKKKLQIEIIMWSREDDINMVVERTGELQQINTAMRILSGLDDTTKNEE